MLSFMQGNQAVGLYNAAYRIVLLLLFIPSVINIAIFPVMSRLYGSSRGALKKIVEKYFKLMILLGIPIGVGVTLLASQIINIIFGKAYLESTPALQILIWATVCTFANAAFVQLFQSTNKQILMTKVTFIGMIVNITLNLILIPKFSYIAASFNTLITEFLLLTMVLILVNRSGYLVKGKILSLDVIKIIISSLIMGMFIWLFKDLNLFILIFASAFLYLIVVLALKGINSEDINIIKNIRS
jgi:O-antigen/teichoic acid export membrane protein